MRIAVRRVEETGAEIRPHFSGRVAAVVGPQAERTARLKRP